MSVTIPLRGTHCQAVITVKPDMATYRIVSADNRFLTSGESEPFSANGISLREAIDIMTAQAMEFERNDFEPARRIA